MRGGEREVDASAIDVLGALNAQANVDAVLGRHQAHEIGRDEGGPHALVQRHRVFLRADSAQSDDALVQSRVVGE